jgi:hypothetical protein
LTLLLENIDFNDLDNSVHYELLKKELIHSFSLPNCLFVISKLILSVNPHLCKSFFFSSRIVFNNEEKMYIFIALCYHSDPEIQKRGYLLF